MPIRKGRLAENGMMVESFAPAEGATTLSRKQPTLMWRNFEQLVAKTFHLIPSVRSSCPAADVFSCAKRLTCLFSIYKPDLANSAFASPPEALAGQLRV
jgi:hypothetical protein